MTTLNQRIAALETQRVAAVRAYETIVQTAINENRDLTDAEQTAAQVQEEEITSRHTEIERLRAAEAVLARAAVPPNVVVTVADPPRTVPAQPHRAPDYKAADFTRMAIAIMVAGHWNAHEYARSRWGDDQLADIIRMTAMRSIVGRAPSGPMSGLPGGIPTNPANQAPGMGGDSLIRLEHMGEQFIEMLRPALIATRMPNMRRLEFDNAGTLRIPRQTGGVSGGYVGEGQSIRVQRLNFAHMDLTPSKLAVIVPTTNELLRRSSPSIEQMIRDDMLEGTARTIDNVFFSAAAAAAGPAGILNGIPATAGGEIPEDPGPGAAAVTGVTEALRAMIYALRERNVPMIAPVWVMTTRTREYLRLLRTTQEIFAFKAEIDAGTLLGYPIIDSTSIPIPWPGETAPKTVYALIDSSQVIWADDLAPVIDASEHASIQADDAPGTPPAAPYWSAFQNDSVFMRIRMSHTWNRRHDVAVAWALTSE